jgi:hypothetical protein
MAGTRSQYSLPSLGVAVPNNARGHAVDETGQHGRAENLMRRSDA